MDVDETYGDNYFMKYVGDTIMLHTLNSYRAGCQLYSVKLERIKKALGLSPGNLF